MSLRINMMSDYKRIFVILIIRCYFICNTEVFADNVIFTHKTVCPENKLIFQCNLPDKNTVTTIYRITIFKLDEEMVTISLITGTENYTISWNDKTIENISSTEGSTIFPANESRLIVEIGLTNFDMREDSMMFRCTVSGEGITGNLTLTVWKEEIGCPSVTTTSPTTTSFATDQKIQAEYVNILVYIIACTMLRTVIRLLTELLV